MSIRMKALRFLLFPFSILYGIIVWIRNFFYDRGIFHSKRFSVPIITVGNLSVGGTGKSPMVEYLIRLLSDQKKLVTLSRGYKRTTKGFLLATHETTFEDIGDEPFQYFNKFKAIHVAVDAKRVEGVENIMNLLPQTEVIVLDDAYQHRKIQAGFSVLLTSFHDLYAEDYLLPVGTLREGKKGADRAQHIIVTKCPNTLSEDQQKKVIQKLQPKAHQKVFFTTICYDTSIYDLNGQKELSSVRPEEIFAVAGIAKPDYFFDHLQVLPENKMVFPDHYAFTAKDFENILKAAQGKTILTTEKDFMRLSAFEALENIYYLPIRVAFLKDEAIFQQDILQFVG